MVGDGGITRRELLSGAAAGVVAVGLAGCASNGGGSPTPNAASPGSTAPSPPENSAPATTNPRPDPGARTRVAIVGAGFAGMTAALDLRDAGWDVVVLEARDRVGGRVFTRADPFTDGLHAEAGGESIDDDHDRIQAMLKRFGLATERRLSAKIEKGDTHYRGARSRTSDFVNRNDGAAASDYVRFTTAVENLADGVDPEHPERFARASELDAMSLDEFIGRQHLSPEGEFLIRTEYRGEYNAEAADLSMLFIAQQTVVSANASDSGVETMRISGGNSKLAQAMAAELGDRVVMNAPVSAVRYDATGVRVDAAGRSVDASHLVLALPMPPLRSIAFTPELPADVRATIAGFDLGSAAKVSTQYQRRFWEDWGGSGMIETDLPFGIAWAATDSYTSDAGILSQFITGKAARDAAALDDAARISQFQQQLDQVYPEGVALRTPHAMTMAWAREPFTGGGYAIYKPGQMQRFWPVVRTGTGPIKFAGEHTETLAGYMESAIRSGHRVATEIGAPPP